MHRVAATSRIRIPLRIQITRWAGVIGIIRNTPIRSGAFLGDIVETIFCRLTAGIWMSRSSFVWGPFSIVWGVALAAATMLLYRYRKYSDRFLFFMGTFLGGAYEYTCSAFG